MIAHASHLKLNRPSLAGWLVGVLKVLSCCRSGCFRREVGLRRLAECSYAPSGGSLVLQRVGKFKPPSALFTHLRSRERKPQAVRFDVTTAPPTPNATVGGTERAKSQPRLYPWYSARKNRKSASGAARRKYLRAQSYPLRHSRVGNRWVLPVTKDG
jgi:hypothetical protein